MRHSTLNDMAKPSMTTILTHPWKFAQGNLFQTIQQFFFTTVHVYRFYYNSFLLCAFLFGRAGTHSG